MNKKIMICIFLTIFLYSISYASWTKYFVETPTTSSGSKTITLDTYSTALKSLSIKTSGVIVAISIKIYEDDMLVEVKTLSIATAGTWKYTTGHRIDKLKLVWTITNGSLDKVVFKAN